MRTTNLNSTAQQQNRLPFVMNANTDEAVKKSTTNAVKEAFLKLHIKNMVSMRCKIVVKSELEKLGYHVQAVELGEATIAENLSLEERGKIKAAFLKLGLELLDDRKAILIERLKNLIIELVHYADEWPKIKTSEYIGEKLNHSYTYLANIFSAVTGTTIEQYIISHKIEKVKKLLAYDQLSETEIAYKLHYSSVAHLSNQFKKVTGYTPSYFRKLRRKQLTALDKM